MTPEQEIEYLRSKVGELESKVIDTDIDLAFAFSLPPLMEKVFRLLLQYPRMTTEQLAARLPSGSEPKCSMFRMRKFLLKHGVELKSQRYIGYWIEPADKKKLIETAKATLSGNTKAA